MKYYRCVFSRKDDIEHNTNMYLSSIETKTLHEQQKVMLEQPVEIRELDESLNALKGNKSPGSSGFQPEFYKAMWPYIKYCFYNMCLESFKQKRLPQTLREGVLILIPKAGKSKDDIKGYRPITLLNTGYKIISATIAKRIRAVLPSIIGPEQTGFVPGRYR